MNARTNKAGWSRWLLGLAVVGGAGLMLPNPAEAGHIRKVKHQPERVWVPPVYETRARTIVVPAVLEQREERIWHEPVYEIRRVRVMEPARVVKRRVARYDAFGGLIGFEMVEEVVRPARKVWKEQRVLVREGYFETVYRPVCVRAETTRVVHEEVLVKPGHWAPREILRVHDGPRGHRTVKARRPHRDRGRGPNIVVRFD